MHWPDQVQGPATRDRFGLYRISPERWSFLVVNHRRELLADPRVRRALSMTWDRNRFATDMRRGLVRPIGAPPFGASVTPVFDPKAAGALLEQAGYRDTNGDGVRDRGGVPLRISLLHPAGARVAQAEARAYALDVRRAGILLDLVPVDPPQLLARLQKGEFDLAPLLWEGRPDEDVRPLYAEKGVYNYGGLRSARVEELLDELRTVEGPAARRHVLEGLGQVLADDAAAIFLYRHDNVALIERHVHGLAARGEYVDVRRAWVLP